MALTAQTRGRFDHGAGEKGNQEILDCLERVAVTTPGTAQASRALVLNAASGIASGLATLAAMTTCNATSMTATNTNATLGLITTVNATNMTLTGMMKSANSNTTTTATIATADITNAEVDKLSMTIVPVTAAGNVAANAANLSYGMNVVTATDNTKGVILPVATAGGIVEVLQTVNAKQLAIYPQANSTISGLSVNAALNTGVANTAADAATTQNVYFKFIATNATQWYVQK